MIPFWKLLPAKAAHDWAPWGLRLWSRLCPVTENDWLPFQWKGLHFPNRLGVAGGVDKNAELLKTWPHLGFGFTEIGTVTPRPQGPNPGRILDRDWNNKCLWNKMGFPSQGAGHVARNLREVGPLNIPLFVNIGKNRETPAERAFEDYSKTTQELAPFADAIVVNVSSPNTQGLRDLQDKKILRGLIESVVKHGQGKPILVKFSPDEEDSSLRESLSAAREAGAEGFILTNTTLQRPKPSPFPETGGVSGAFLTLLSRRSLRIAVDHFRSDQKPLLISAGGILTPEEIKERLDLGADLVQIYSALVFEGPGFPRKAAQFFRNEGFRR